MNSLVHRRKYILACNRILQVAERETTLTTKSNEARARAEASFRKEERAKEGQEAMMEYQANTRSSFDGLGVRAATCSPSALALRSHWTAPIFGTGVPHSRPLPVQATMLGVSPPFVPALPISATVAGHIPAVGGCGWG
jgi:hypothetical protein